MTDETKPMTPVEYAFATPQDLGGVAAYRAFCRTVGLQPIPDGWGMLFCKDAHGRHWTRITADVAYLRMIVSANGSKTLANLEIPAEKFPNERAGWPDEWQAAR